MQLTISRQGMLFLWPLRHVGADGKDNTAWVSGRDAAMRAQGKWTKISWNSQLKAYEIEHAQGNIPEPEWPAYSMKRILEIAAKDSLINTVDHPVIQGLVGAV